MATSVNSSSERREKQKAELRAKILEAARELIVSEGVDSFSMRKVAGKIGYTATAIYFHFQDKETLLQELVDQDFIQFRNRMDPARVEPDPIRRIMLMGRAFVDFFSRNPSHFRFLFMTPNLRAVPSEKVATQGNPAEDNYCLLKEAVQEGLKAGRFRRELADADEICQILIGTVHGCVTNHICRDAHPWIEFRPVEQMSRLAMQAVMRGMLRDPEERNE